MKTKRLFARTVGSDGVWWYCGGPSLEDAFTGLCHVIKEDVRQAFDGELGEDFSLELETREMTDEEVGQLGDM